MRYTLFAILLLAAPGGAFALTWDFDDGSTWGWTALESASYSNKLGSNDPLQSEVVDGVWRIAPVPGRRPTVELRMPLIGQDSALFDRLTLRLRLIHHSPTEGPLKMSWSNAEQRRRPIDPEERPSVTGRGLQPYPIDWEEITLDPRALAADQEREIIWQDTLYTISIDMMLYRDSWDIDNHPKFLEIDWIQLTGAEELAQGELSPRDLGVGLGPPGALFAEPDFFPLGEGIGIPSIGQGSLREESFGAVGDVDGDGDADLVALWHRLVDRERQLGWTVASNDGLGGFEPTQEFLLATEPADHPPFMDLRGSDFDGDGLLDLVVDYQLGGNVEVWYNWGGGFEPTLQLFDVPLIGLADGDGDGDTDLLVSDFFSPPEVIMWINDGYDFVDSDTFVLDSEEWRWPYLSTGQPLGEAASLLWNDGSCFEPQDVWQLTRPWAAIEEPPLSFAAPINPCALHLIADLDGNGTVDMLYSPESIDPFREFDYYGLALWRLDASGGLARHSLLDWKVLPSEATASDLNGDGVLDVAMIAGNSPIGPALVVLLGQRNGAPVLEGYYPLPSEGNQVFASDVNGDGDTDLVVLGTSPASDHGGVFVFINQGTPATAVAVETATPTTFALDGRDAQGQPVATGVYVYRLQVDEQTRTRKMVKLE